MIPNVLTVFYGGVALASGGRSGSDRDNLLSLLEQVDTSSNINNLLDRIPLHSFGSLLETRVVTTSEPPRRRHSPCEANDGAGDGNQPDCLTRRFALIGNVIQLMQTPDSNGVTPDGGRLQLRMQFADLLTHFATVNDLTNQIYFNITNPINGSMQMVDYAIRKVFNKESLMALSINNAWMNLINVTNLASTDIDKILQKRDNATYQIANWFNALQTAEEYITYDNQQQVLDRAWASFSDAANTMTDSQTQVWKALTDLDNSMGGSEDLSGSLAASLSDAAESVDNSLSGYEMSLPEVAANAEQNVNQTLDSLVSQYGAAAQRVVESVQSASTAKQQVARTSAESAIATQEASIYNATLVAQKAIDKSIGDLTTSRDRFLNYTDLLYSAAQNAINLNISNQTADIQNRSSAVSAALAVSDGLRTQIASLISQVSSDEKQAVGNSGSNRLSELNTATATLNDIAAASVSKSQSTLQMAQQVSSGAVAAVGTSSQGPLSDLNNQYEEQQTVAANQANQIALASQSSSSSLAASAAAGSNQITASGNVVNGQVDGVANAGFAGLDSVSRNLPQGVSTDSISEAIRAANFRNEALSHTAGENATGSAYGAAGAAEDELSNEADNMNSAGASAASRVSSTIDAIGVFRSLSGIVSSMSSSTGAAAADSFADSASAMGDLASKLNTMLTDAVSKASGSSAGTVGVSSTVAAAMEAAEKLIAEAQQKVGGGSLDKQNVLGILGEALTSVGLSGSQFNASMGMLGKQLDDSLSGATANMDSFLGGMSSGASDMITANMQSIEELKASSAIQVSSMDATQLDKIRAVAANVDALMSNMRNFLTANNPKLFDQVQKLPVVGQRMFLALNGLREKAYAIRVQAYNAAGGTATEESYQKLLNQIKDLNSTAFDTLGQISSTFNTSANGYLSELMSQVNDLATQFQDQANNMKARLNAIASSASSAEGDLRVTPEGQKVIAQMQSIDSQLSAFATQGNSMVSEVSDPSKFSRPANYSNMVSRVINLTNNAGSTDDYVSSLMTTLNGFASSTVNDAKSSVTASNEAAASELSRQAQLAALNAGVAQSQLAARQASMKQLHGDANQMVADYAQEAKLQAQAQTNKASYVYDSIQGAQADAMNTLGRIAQKYASAMSDGSAQTATNTASSSAAIANLRQQIARMAYLFDGYMQSEQRQYATSEEDRSGFTVALLTDVKRKMSALDNVLYQIDQQITNQYNRANSELIAIDSSELEGEIENLTEQLNAWQAAQNEKITAVQKTAVNITDSATAGTVFNYTSVQDQIEKTISVAARTAVAFIGYYKGTVPGSLTDIVNDPVTAFENAYNALAAK